MPAQKSTATSLFSALAGTLGFSVLAGVLVTIMVAPAIAVTGITANNTIGIFDALPEYLELDAGSNQNKIVAQNPDGSYADIAVIYKQNREEVTLEQISDHLECAAIAGEDRRFYEHGGVDVPSLVRAFLGQVTGDDGAGGASTLTMQLVRNILQQQALNDDSMTPEQQQEEIKKALAPTLDRKIKEMKLAIGLEKNHTKEEILSGYLNIAGFGGNTYGVQAAATEFFSKTAADVTVAEAASLIAIVQFPNSRSLNNPENFAANQERRDVILRAMAAEGCITEAERDEALAIPVDPNFVHPSPARVGCINAADKWEFICDYATRPAVLGEIQALGATPEERISNFSDKGGYTLVLTVNPELQNIAWDTVNQWAPNNETRFQLGAAATTVQTGTGFILSMAQNKNFDNRPPEQVTDPLTSTSVNFAADLAHGGSQGFQPGSTYKPYVLLAYLAAGNGVQESFDAGKLQVDQAAFKDTCPTVPAGDGPPWGGTFKFRNDAGERGRYTVMRGTAASVNSVFVQMAMRVDQCQIKELANSIGVHNANGSELSTRPGCAIGGCENNLDTTTQAAAYAAIANQGVYCKPIMVQKVIVTATGEELPGQNAECGQSLVTPGVANTAAHAMAGVMTGTAGASNPNDGTPYIGKTGTTDESVHTWMVGTSTAAATAVWVGNVQGTQALRNIRVNGTQAAVLRHRIFRPIAQAIDVRYPGSAFPGPDPALLIGTPTTVPSVVGLSPEAARQAIELAELNYADGGEVDSDRPAGVVASSDPGGGASVPRGTTVTVYRSNGQASTVPNVVGQSEGAATSALQAAGFSNIQTQCVDDEDLGIGGGGGPGIGGGGGPGGGNGGGTVVTPPGAPNTVTAQDPAGGTVTNRNATIRLIVYKNSC